MNWYGKSQVITAGVGDFAGGSVKYQILNEFPEREGDLTEDQMRVLRNVSTQYSISVLDKAEYFKRYPSHVFFSMYDLHQYADWKYRSTRAWNDDIALILSLLKTKSYSSIPMGNMADEVYETLLKDPRAWELDEEYARRVLTEEENYPKFFVDWFIKQYPAIYDAIKATDPQQKYGVVLRFLSMPTTENYNIVASMMEATRKEGESPDAVDLQRKIYMTLLSYEKTGNDLALRLNQRRVDNSMSGRGDSICEEIDALITTHQNGQVYEDEYSPLTEYPTDIGDSNVTLCNFGEYRIRYEDIMKAYSIMRSNPETYFDLTVGTLSNIRDTDYAAPEGVPEDKLGLFLLNNDEQQIVYIGEAAGLNQRYENYGSYQGPVKAVRGLFSLGQAYQAEFYRSWFADAYMEASRHGNLDYFYLDVLNSDAFEDIVDRASSAIAGVAMHGNKMITEDEYEHGRSYHFSTELPFFWNLANDIFDRIPMHLRTQGKKMPLWYALCSGKLPCSHVAERALEYPSDAMKVMTHIACAGDGAENIRRAIHDKVATKSIESKSKLKEGLPEFLADPRNCKTRNLADFPDLFNHIVDLCRRTASPVKVYSDKADGLVTMSDFVIERLGDIVIYIINAPRFVEYFGKETLQAAGYSPYDMKGFYSPQYSFSQDHPSICVFSGQLEGSAFQAPEGQVISLLGLSSNPELQSFDEEGTLWHEATHSLIAQVIPGQNEDASESSSKWLRSPNELVAINYGNLQHVKQKLTEFFESNMPLSGRIEAGLMAHVASEIIETFAWEFQGMAKDQALAVVNQNIEDFQEQVTSATQSMGREEQIKLLVSIFTQFFMGKLLRGKIESELEMLKHDLGREGEKIDFRDPEVVVPEQYEYIPPGTKDKFIQELQTRDDYRQFITAVKNRVQTWQRSPDFERNPESYRDKLRPYVHRSDKTSFREPTEFSHLLRLMFEPPISWFDIDVTNTNSQFADLIPPTLKRDVIEIIEKEQALRSTPLKQQPETVVSPEEAEETGQFMAQMDEEYGPDWIWMARNRGWYRKAMKDLVQE